MNKFTFSYPTKVYFGEGSAAQAFGAELDKVGETVMLAYGSGSIKRNGVYDKMKAMLEQTGKKVVDFSGIMSNPTYTKVQEGTALAREFHVDFILAVGGSVIDCCKVLSGAFDTLSHAMETYLGNSDSDNVSDDVTLAIMCNMVINMRRLLVNINDMEARSNLMWDSAMAENGILKCGRLTDFQAHQIEHQLGAYTDCNHGQGLAVIHPVYYRHIVKDAPDKFARFAKVVFNEDTAEAGVDALENFIRECGLPVKMSQLKSTVEITPEVLRQVADTCNIIKSNPRELDREEIYGILMECL